VVDDGSVGPERHGPEFDAFASLGYAVHGPDRLVAVESVPDGVLDQSLEGVAVVPRGVEGRGDVHQKSEGVVVDADAHTKGVGGGRVIGGVGHAFVRPAGRIRRSVWV